MKATKKNMQFQLQMGRKTNAICGHRRMISTVITINMRTIKYNMRIIIHSTQ